MLAAFIIWRRKLHT